MISAIICWVIALGIFAYPRTPEARAALDKMQSADLSNEERDSVQKDLGGCLLRGSIYAVIFLVLCNWFGIPVFGGSDDDTPAAAKIEVALYTKSIATAADETLEPQPFNDWLHAQPDRADDSSIVKFLDRANAPAEDELDIAHAKPYRIVSIESFPSNNQNKRYRLYVHAPDAVTPLQRAQTAIKAALTYKANYYKRRKLAGAKAWEIDVWLVASPKKSSTYAAWLSYYREGKTADGADAGFIMDVQALDLPYAQMVDGENYFADMERYILIERAAH